MKVGDNNCRNSTQDILFNLIFIILFVIIYIKKNKYWRYKLLIFINICIAISALCILGIITLTFTGIIFDSKFKLNWIYSTVQILFLIYGIFGTLALLGGIGYGIFLLFIL